MGKLYGKATERDRDREKEGESESEASGRQNKTTQQKKIRSKAQIFARINGDDDESLRMSQPKQNNIKKEQKKDEGRAVDRANAAHTWHAKIGRKKPTAGNNKSSAK